MAQLTVLVAGAIWANVMPDKLAKYLPQMSAADRAALFGSITDVTKYPRGNPIREGTISGMLYHTISVEQAIMLTLLSLQLTTTP